METITVKTPVSERALKEEGDLLSWANKEAVPALREIRSFANLVSTIGVSSTSAGDGSWTNLWSSDAMPTDVDWEIEVSVIGRGGEERVNYRRAAFFTNIDGVVSQVGVTEALWTFETSAGPDVRLEVSGQTVRLDGMDDGVSPFDWHVAVRVFATPRP